MSVWAVIDSSGLVINRLAYGENELPPNPHPCYPDHLLVNATGHVNIGYTYADGIFTEPVSIPNPNPTPLPITTSPEQEEIASLKADIETLSSSLTKVINALNTITKK